MNMTEKTAAIVRHILATLEQKDWKLHHIDDGGDEFVYLNGEDTAARIEEAFAIIDGVEEAVVYVKRPVAERFPTTFVLLIPSNEDDVLSDCGELLANLDLLPPEGTMKKLVTTKYWWRCDQIVGELPFEMQEELNEEAEERIAEMRRQGFVSGELHAHVVMDLNGEPAPEDGFECRGGWETTIVDEV